MNPQSFNLIAPAELLPAIIKHRRDLKAFFNNASADDRDAALHVAETAIDLCIDDVSPLKWPDDTMLAFVDSLSKATKSVAASHATSAPAPHTTALGELFKFADLLVAMCAADARIKQEQRLRACRAWASSRLAGGIDPSGMLSFVDAAASVLEFTGLSRAEITAEVQAELLSALTTPGLNGKSGVNTNGSAPPPPQPIDPVVVETPSAPVPAEPQTATGSPTAAEQSSQEEDVVDDERPRVKRVPRQWRQPFRTEDEIIKAFPDFTNDIVQMCTSQGLQGPSLALNTAKHQFDKWLADGQKYGNTGCLASFVQSGSAIAAELIVKQNFHDAFRVANLTAEICKVLVARNRDKFQPVLEGLVSLGCRALSAEVLARPVSLAVNANRGEIELLRADFARVLDFALGTFFKIPERAYMRGRGDAPLSERIANDVVAAHFDARLRHLIESSRPQVKEYVRTNMPVVYRLKLSGKSRDRKDEWESLLRTAGYDDAVQLLRDMGDLIDPEQVGKVPPRIQEEVIRAAGQNDYPRLIELLSASAKELRAFLFAEAQRRLQYREPATPFFKNEAVREIFRRAQRLARSTEPRSTERALQELQDAWKIEITSLELLDWVVYMEARLENYSAAEQKIETLQRRRGTQKNFVTEWNLAVLKYERQNESAAYQLLVPLLDYGKDDPDLVVVLLALSLKLDDRARFLTIVPRSMSLRYHPLAIVVAHEMKNTVLVDELLGQLRAQWRGQWELPPIEQRFKGLEDLKQSVVNPAIVEGQVDQLIQWLEARIRAVRTWIPNYLALAWVRETWAQDVDGAFHVLRNRLEVARRRPERSDSDEDKLRQQRSIDEACEDLLNLCRRTKRSDLGQAAFKLARTAGVRTSLLESFGHFAPGDDETKPVPKLPVPVLRPELDIPTTFQDPKLTDRVVWVNAGLAKIRNVHTHLERAKEIQEFTNIIVEVAPTESGEALNLIRNITGVVETFARTDPENPDDRGTRRTLYSRVASYEKELARLLSSNALSQSLAHLITPYRHAIQQVVGDLSRLAGVGPVLDVAIENQFVSVESARSTIVLRVTDKSERPVSDVGIEVVSETPSVGIHGSRRRSIARLEPQRSELLSLPIEQTGQLAAGTSDSLKLAVSLRASAEGFPDVDLGIKKLVVPIKTFRDGLGCDQIPKVFQEVPLNPQSPGLFRGRTTLLESIRNSFYGGVQRERFFFDGIRRVGKTSILNFLPQHLPPNALPVPANFDMLGLQGRCESATVLRRFCEVIAGTAKRVLDVEVEVDSEARFDTDPGQAFSTFLTAFASAAPERVPLLMMDEFQDLLGEIAASGSGRARDTLVLDQLRGNLDAGRIFAVFTGSVRFDRLTEIIEHRIFGSLKRLPISFLSEDSVSEVLRTGFEKWGNMSPEAVARVYELTGGYPWLVQKYGLALTDRLNEERRTVVTPQDVEDVTNETILWGDSHFEFWWPTKQLGRDEERFVEWILRKYDRDQTPTIRGFFADVGYKEQTRFRRAFENLRACEVLDSRQTEYVKFSGTVMRRWLEHHLQDNQLQISRGTEGVREDVGQAGIFVDHENLFHSLIEISRVRGVQVPERGTPARRQWFAKSLDNIMGEMEKRLGRMSQKVAVAFWERPQEAELMAAYHAHDFTLRQPEDTGKGNEVDFKVADEVRRGRERSHKEGSSLTRAVIVTGDRDLSHAVRGLKGDGVNVIVIGGSRNTGDRYIVVVGSENYVVLDDICGL